MPSTGAEASDSSPNVERKRKMSSVSVAARKKRHVIPADEEDEENGDDVVDNNPESRTSSTEQAPAAGLDPKPKQESVDDSVHSVLTDIFKDVRELVTCKICFRLLYEPYTLSCGHTYCYSCLSSWFRPYKKTCPDCRTAITESPAPAYLVRELVHKLILKDELLANDDSRIQHMFWQREEAYLVERDKSGTDARFQGLFGGLFKPISRATRHGPIVDVDDNVLRCPQCNWELEDGVCSRCGPIDDSLADEDLIDDDDDFPSEEDSFGDTGPPLRIQYISEGEDGSSDNESREETDGNTLHRSRPTRSRLEAGASSTRRQGLRDISDEAGPNIGRRLADHYGILYETQSEDNPESNMTDEDNGSDLEGFIAADDEEDEQDNDTDEYEEEGGAGEENDDDDDDDDDADQRGLFEIFEGRYQAGADDGSVDWSEEEARITEEAVRMSYNRTRMHGVEEHSRRRPIARGRLSSSEGNSLNASIITGSTAPSASNPTYGRTRRTGGRTSTGRTSTGLPLGSAIQNRRMRLIPSDEDTEDVRVDEEESEDEVVNRRQRRRTANGPR